MARKSRIHFAGAFYHVMLRGNNGQKIFAGDDDRLKFLELLSEGVSKFGCRIHAFCLMTNHVHLAVQVGEIPLSNIIQNISFRYARIINKKTNKIGHLFQGRYKAILVDADNYLLQLIKYIHLNPTRAKMVINPEDYEWSSHNAYLGKISFQWLTISYVLEYFSNIKIQAHNEYLKFVNEKSCNVKEINFDISNQKSFPAIADDAFMKKLELLQENEVTIKTITLDLIIWHVCEFYQIEESKLHDKSRNRVNAKIRSVIAWLAREFKILTTSHVANYFKRDPSTISRIMNEIALFPSADSALHRIKNIIDNANTQA